MDERLKLSALQAVAMLKSGELSPGELITAAENRRAEVDPQINALPTACYDRARQKLEEHPGIQSTLLAGLPIAIKDLTDVAGVRTTMGSPIYRENVPAESNILVRRLEDNGALVVAKSNTPEFGAGASTFNEVFGFTKNPWNLSRSVAGSSGGSAAALAAGEVWLASGSDMGGSLRTPASFNSVVGLRPSPGRIARTPGINAFSPLGVEGPMARSVADAALMLDAMCGPHPCDPMAGDFPPRSYRSVIASIPEPLRFGFSKNLGIVRVDPEISEICRDAVFSLASTGSTVAAKTPDLSGIFESFHVLRAVSFATELAEELEKHRDKLKPEVIWNIEKGQRINAAEIGQAEAKRRHLVATMGRFFTEFDVLACPTAIIPAYPVQWRYVEEAVGTSFDTYIDWVCLTFAATLTGCPAISVPCGFTQSGLPVGLQIIGPPKREDRVLAAALLIEMASGIPDLLPIDPRQPS